MKQNVTLLMHAGPYQVQMEMLQWGYGNLIVYSHNIEFGLFCVYKVVKHCQLNQYFVYNVWYLYMLSWIHGFLGQVKRGTGILSFPPLCIQVPPSSGTNGLLKGFGQ